MSSAFWWHWICHSSRQPDCNFDTYCAGRSLDNSADHVLESEDRP